ncbi:MAG: putative secreted protein [Chlamydiia bacterium]|nr:putative secreted protein [Chlamydiia bacterium]
MYFRVFFKSHVLVFLFSLFLSLSSLCQTAHLEAGGWGKTDKAFEHEGVKWNSVYFDMNGLDFIASIPNYSGAALQNNDATIRGNANEKVGYAIVSPFNPDFTPPKSLKKFIKMVQQSNPDYTVKAVNAKKLGAKYALDLTPKSTNEKTFWRFVSTHNRLIQMVTEDTNESRRFYFFDSLRIQ